MARRQKGKRVSEQRDAPQAAKPFNNPFADHARALKRRLRDELDARVTRAREEPSSAGANGGEGGFASTTDEEAFLAAVEDAAPLRTRANRVPARARAARTTVPAEKPDAAAIDFLADEHFDLRYSDRFIRARAAGVSRETLERLERGAFAVRSHVDLHGMALDDAKTVVDAFLADCQKRGERCVLVITGKGKNSPRQVGVLREQIPAWLARGPSARRVLAMATARACDGGEGALYVLLRRSRTRKTRIDLIAGGGA